MQSLMFLNLRQTFFQLVGFRSSNATCNKRRGWGYESTIFFIYEETGKERLKGKSLLLTVECFIPQPWL